MSKYLLAFYRRDSKIYPLYSDSPEFYDVNLEEHFIAKIVPLSCIPSDFEWTINSALGDSIAPLQDIFKAPYFLHTASEETSPYSLLMYTSKSTPMMSRTGVLLQKKNTGFQPVCIKLGNDEYIVELKGSGTPQGGFAGFHLRNQAGTPTKGHLRLTGGATLDCVKKEYEMLLDVDGQFSAQDKDMFFKGVGYIDSYLVQGNSNIHLGILLRLSPSSIRYSFSKNKAFEDIFKPSATHFFFQAGKQTAQFLSLNPPCIHHNNSWNNMVVCDEEQLFLSDIEELDRVPEGHCNLDFVHSVFPYLLFQKNPEPDYVRLFKQGLNAVLDQPIPEELCNVSTINQWLFHNHIGLPSFLYTCQSKKNMSYVMDNIYATRQFVLSDYFNGDHLAWARDVLRPQWQAQRDILDVFSAYISENGMRSFESVFKGSIQENAATLYQNISDISEDVSQFFMHRHNFLLGLYVYKLPAYVFFLRNIQDVATIKLRQDTLDTFLDQLDHFISGNSFKLCGEYTPESFESFDAIFNKDLGFWLYPFLIWMMVFLENERHILTGALLHSESLDKKQLRLCEDSLAVLKQKQKTLLTSPQLIYQLCCQSDAAVFSFLKLPYH